MDTIDNTGISRDKDSVQTTDYLIASERLPLISLQVMVKCICL